MLVGISRFFVGILLLSLLGLFQNVFALNNGGFIVPNSSGTISSPLVSDQNRASEDLNTIILDSYRARLDKVLQQLYINIDAASKGNQYLQIRALENVRNDLDTRLDAIADTKLSTNRKKILVGVYLYLKTDVELRIKKIEAQ